MNIRGEEMSEKETSFRASVSYTFRRKPPFNRLLAHMGKVRECVDLLGDELLKYSRGSYKNFSKLSKKVSEIEHETDLIKGNVRNHLPSSIFIPVDKGKFLWAFREQDAILDHVENLVNMFDMRHTKIPKELQELFVDHTKLVMKTVEAMEDAVENIKNLLETSFVRREWNQTKELIHTVHDYKWKADQKKFELTKGIYEFEKKLDPMDVYHLLKIAGWVEDTADHAENVTDWLRAMIAR